MYQIYKPTIMTFFHEFIIINTLKCNLNLVNVAALLHTMCVTLREAL